MALRRPRTWLIAGILVALVAAAVPAWILLQQRRDRDRLVAAAGGYARAWAGGQLAGVRFAGADSAQVSKRVAAITARLTPSSADLPAVQVLSVGAATDDAATARLRVRWDLGQGRVWSYQTDLGLRRANGAWSVAWTPQSVQPSLVDSTVLSTTRTTPARADIVGTDGTVLVTSRPVVRVGLQPSRVKDPAQTIAAVAALVDVDTAALARRLAAARPNDFVDVVTLRRPAYDAVKDRLQPIPGTVFTAATLALAPTAGFARALLGSVGPATKEIVDSAKGRVAAADTVGLSGLQRTYDQQLAGTAGLVVRAVPATGTTPAPVTLFEVAPVAGRALTLTLDTRVQEAAEAALSTATKPAGLVAVRPSTGEILAVANGGPNADGYDRALLGQYPPGSTFKIATTLALLQHGVTTQTPTACPPSVTVHGKVFTNAEHEVLGTVPFAKDFAQSCNTAFVGSAAKITGAQLSDAAAALGYGATDTLGATAFMGTVPRGEDPVEHAADAIGQGRVLASPLTVAGVSAAIAAGRRMPLSLVVGASSSTPNATASSSAAPSPDPAPAAGQAPAPLPAGPVADLQGLMREVVTTGTGTALLRVPGDPVHGKTGTAEYGNATPPATHAWFTGYQGDLAFAVVVEGGGFGAKAAAPLAADFLTRLG